MSDGANLSPAQKQLAKVTYELELAREDVLEYARQNILLRKQYDNCNKERFELWSENRRLKNMLGLMDSPKTNGGK